MEDLEGLWPLIIMVLAIFIIYGYALFWDLKSRRSYRYFKKIFVAIRDSDGSQDDIHRISMLLERVEEYDFNQNTAAEIERLKDRFYDKFHTPWVSSKVTYA